MAAPRYDNVGASSERARELAALLNQSLEAAAESGRKSLPILQAEIKYLNQERDELARIAKEKKQDYAKQVREGEQQIDELRKQAGDLKALVERLDEVLKKSAGSEKSLGLAKLHERARLLEAEADFDEAIRLYEQVVQAAGADQVAVVKTRLDQLKNAWARKGDKHAEARQFIYETWPTLDVAGLQRDLKKAESALEECKAVGDKLTPRKLLRVNVAHTLNLKKQLEALKKKDSEDNRNKAKAVVEISARLLALHNEASAFVGPRSD